MDALLLVLMGIVACLLLLFKAVILPRTMLSTFELARRLENGDKIAKREHRRQEALPLLESALHIKVLLLIVFFTSLAIATWGWGGILIAVAVIALVNPLSRTSWVQQVGRRIYDSHEERLLKLVFHPYVRPVLHFLRGQSEVVSERALGSHEELVHIIKQSDIVNEREQELLLQALDFPHRIVHEVYIPAKKVKTVGKKEMLGPKLLDELHQSGQSFFPVIDGSFQQVVGILSAGEIMNTERQGKLTAEKAMSPKIVRLKKDDTLEQALGDLLREKQFYGIVMDNHEENIGVITVESIIAALLGPAR